MFHFMDAGCSRSTSASAVVGVDVLHEELLFLLGVVEVRAKRLIAHKHLVIANGASRGRHGSKSCLRSCRRNDGQVRKGSPKTV